MSFEYEIHSVGIIIGPTEGGRVINIFRKKKLRCTLKITHRRVRVRQRRRRIIINSPGA